MGCSVCVFKEDMYELYLKHVNEYGENNTTIERKNVNGNYEKDNCKWATNKEQANNRRNNRLFKAISPKNTEYILKNQTELAKQHNLNAGAINSCLNKRYGYKSHKGWKFEYIGEDNVVSY